MKSSIPDRDRGAHRRGIAVLFVVTMAFFAPVLGRYLDLWRAQPYTHGYLVAVAVVWLIWRERDVFHASSARATVPLIAAACLSLLSLAAMIADAQIVFLTAAPLLLLLWSVAVFGPGAARRLGPIAGVFLLAAPFWNALSPPLQWLTIKVSGGATRALGVPAVIEGSLVHIPSGSFLIESGCAGVNYLSSGLTVGAIYAMAFLTRWPQRVAVVALAAGLAIAGNWVRVGSLIGLGHATQMESVFITQSFAHIAHGWTIFAVGLVAFFPLARLVERSFDRWWPMAPTATEPAAGAPEIARAMGLRPALLASAAVLAGPVLYLGIGAVPVSDGPLPPVAVIDAAWQPRQEPGGRPYPWQPAFAGPSETVTTAWTDGTDGVLVDRLVYREQSQGAELIGYTSQIAPDGLIAHRRLFGLVGTSRRIVNEVIVVDGAVPVLVWYWYRVGGVETHSAFAAKLLEVWAFLRRATTSELVALSAACDPGDCVRASRSLGSFLGSS